jgi:hypothetical protein
VINAVYVESSVILLFSRSVLDVFRLASLDLRDCHGVKHMKPVHMQNLQHCQKEAVSSTEHATSLVPLFEEDSVDVHGKQNDARPQPCSNQTDEENHGDILSLGASKESSATHKDIRDVVQVGNHTADAQSVAENHTEVQRAGCDVVQQHLEKIALSFLYKN